MSSLLWLFAYSISMASINEASKSKDQGSIDSSIDTRNDELHQQGANTAIEPRSKHMISSRQHMDSISSAATPLSSARNFSIEAATPIETPIVRRRRRLHRRPTSPDRRRPSESTALNDDADEEDEEEAVEEVRGRHMTRQAGTSPHFGSMSAGPRLQATLPEESESDPEVPIIAIPVPPSRNMARLQRSVTYEPGTLPIRLSSRSKGRKEDSSGVVPERRRERT